MHCFTLSFYSTEHKIRDQVRFHNDVYIDKELFVKHVREKVAEYIIENHIDELHIDTSIPIDKDYSYYEELKTIELPEISKLFDEYLPLEEITVKLLNKMQTGWPYKYVTYTNDQSYVIECNKIIGLENISQTNK
jgi:hypothetical protein